MSKISIHAKTASSEARDQYGKFTKTTPNSPYPSYPPSTSPNLANCLLTYLRKLTLKKVTMALALISLLATNGIVLTVAETFFPHSSPFLHRATAHQGLLQTSGTGAYQLILPNNSVYTLYLKPSPTLINLKTLNEVVVKGNLTATPYVIENAEIYPVNISTQNPLK